MKVVLFCGGQGLRIRSASGDGPKPMVRIGEQPLLLHLMRYYAHFGHKDFVLCLGYRSEVIKQYFLTYGSLMINRGGEAVRRLQSDLDDWTISLVETSGCSTIAERLLAVRQYVAGEETFLANYADGLTDLALPAMIESHRQSGKIASFLAVPLRSSLHRVSFDADRVVRKVEPLGQSELWINGGFFVFGREIFDYVDAGEELVEEPFRRLIARQELLAYPYRGFWASVDTAKDLEELEAMDRSGARVWAVWEHGGRAPDRSDGEGR